MRHDELISKLSEFDRSVLRTCCGEDLIQHWGAAVSVTLSFLSRLGLVGYQGEPTVLGREVARILREQNT